MLVLMGSTWSCSSGFQQLILQIFFNSSSKTPKPAGGLHGGVDLVRSASCVSKLLISCTVASSGGCNKREGKETETISLRFSLMAEASQLLEEEYNRLGSIWETLP